MASHSLTRCCADGVGTLRGGRMEEAVPVGAKFAHIEEEVKKKELNPTE